MEPTQQEVNQPESGQQVLFDLESLTATTARSIESITKELKKHKEMLKDGYNNEPTYKRYDEQVKEAKKALNTFKAEVDKQPSMVSLRNKIKDLTAELKEKKSSISDYALEYERISGADQIDIEGEFYKIVKSARLVKSSDN